MKKKSRTAATNLSLFLIALPGILYLLINNYAPMLGIFLAFKNYSLMKGPFKSDWCGFDNFEFLFKTKDAWIMTRNTLLLRDMLSPQRCAGRNNQRQFYFGYKKTGRKCIQKR